MNHFRQGQGWLVSVGVVAIFISSATAQNAANSVPAVQPIAVPAAMTPPPPIPTAPSPMDYFRNLLAMSPQQRESVLAKKSPKVRARILAKVSEYAALDPDERELRLRATELRLYLMPLLQAPPDQRAAQLAAVPADIRDLVQSRLMQWEILPPQLQQEFLENEHTVAYFAGVGGTNNISGEAIPSNAEQSQWNSLSDGEREAMTAQFDEFFELSPVEKQKALGGLTGADREQMEKTLREFNQLPPHQRMQCVHAFAKFANMSPQERAEFLKNAQRWSKMTVSERQAWSDLVEHVPQWPPLPPSVIMPPSMPPMPQNIRVLAATNRG